MPQKHSASNGRFVSGGGGSGGKSVAAPKTQGRATGQAVGSAAHGTQHGAPPGSPRAMKLQADHERSLARAKRLGE